MLMTCFTSQFSYSEDKVITEYLNDLIRNNDTRSPMAFELTSGNVVEFSEIISMKKDSSAITGKGSNNSNSEGYELIVKDNNGVKHTYKLSYSKTNIFGEKQTGFTLMENNKQLGGAVGLYSNPASGQKKILAGTYNCRFIDDEKTYKVIRLERLISQGENFSQEAGEAGLGRMCGKLKNILNETKSRKCMEENIICMRKIMCGSAYSLDMNRQFSTESECKKENCDDLTACIEDPVVEELDNYKNKYREGTQSIEFKSNQYGGAITE